MTVQGAWEKGTSFTAAIPCLVILLPLAIVAAFMVFCGFIVIFLGIISLALVAGVRRTALRVMTLVHLLRSSGRLN
jgi:hypothetical protein